MWTSIPSPLIYATHAILMLIAWALLRVGWHPPERAGTRILTFCGAAGLTLLVLSEPLTRPFEDFVDAYYAGGLAALAGVEGVRAAFASGVHGFVNIPILGFVFVPLAVLPPGAASSVFLLLGIVAIVLAWRIVGHLLELDAREKALLAILFALNGPLINSLKEGNTSHFALLAIAWAWASMKRAQWLRAGVVLAAAALFKLPLLLFGAFAAVRGFLRTALAGLTILAVTGILSVVVFGTGLNAAWYQQFVASSGSEAVGAFNVQSPRAALLRYSHGPRVICEWDGVPVTPKVRVVGALLSVAALLLPVSAAWRIRRRTSTTARAFRLDAEVATVVLLACVLSPLAWSHYYAWGLLPIALLVKHRASLPSLDRVLLGLATLLLSLPVVWPWCNPSGTFAAAYLLFVSHYLVGAGVLLILLFRHTIRGPQPHATAGRILPSAS